MSHPKEYLGSILQREKNIFNQISESFRYKNAEWAITLESIYIFLQQLRRPSNFQAFRLGLNFRTSKILNRRQEA
jgi:hypothetical protein